MIDYCTSRRIFTCIIALLGFSVLVFFVEEYTEEDYDDLSMKNQAAGNGNVVREPAKSSDLAAHSSSECWLNEPYIVLSSCLPCSDFEQKAIKAKHCLPSGFFDQLNCTKSAIMAQRPCTAVKTAQVSAFYWFTAINVVLLVISYLVALNRKENLDRFAYMRVAQQFDE